MRPIAMIDGDVGLTMVPQNESSFPCKPANDSKTCLIAFESIAGWEVSLDRVLQAENGNNVLGFFDISIYGIPELCGPFMSRPTKGQSALDKGKVPGPLTGSAPKHSV